MAQTPLRHPSKAVARSLLAAAALAASATPACSLAQPGTKAGDEGGSGGVGGTFLPAGGGGESPTAYRRRISIAAEGAGAPEDYSLSARFDHASLVADGKSLATGDDVRIVRFAGGRLEELDRVLDPGSSWNTAATRVWFRTRAALGASQRDDVYYLYYGDLAVSAPPSDPKKVYLFWDGFDETDLSAGWKFSDIGPSHGWARPQGGALHLAAQNGDIGGTVDSFSFLHVALTGDFSAEAMVTAAGGLLDSNAKLGGVMVRRSDSATSRQRTICRLKEASRSSSWRVTDGGWTERAELPVGDFAPERQRIDWLSGRTRAFASADGDAWEEAGGAVELGPPARAAVLAGIPLATKQAGMDGWVEVDWFLVRKLVDPEPVVTLSAEEPADQLSAP